MTCRLCACMRLALMACTALMWKMASLVVGGSLVHLTISCSSNLMIFGIVPHSSPEFRRCCLPLDVRLVGISPHSLDVLEPFAGLGEGVEPACGCSDFNWQALVAWSLHFPPARLRSACFSLSCHRSPGSFQRFGQSGILATLLRSVCRSLVHIGNISLLKCLLFATCIGIPSLGDQCPRPCLTLPCKELRACNIARGKTEARCALAVVAWCCTFHGAGIISSVLALVFVASVNLRIGSTLLLFWRLLLCFG